MNKARSSTRTSRKRRRGIKKGEISICQQITIGALSETSTMHFTNGEVRSVIPFKLNTISKDNTFFQQNTLTLQN